MSLVLQTRRSQPFPHFTIFPPKHNDAGVFDLLIDEQFGEAALHALGDRAGVMPAMAWRQARLMPAA
jgi:hypothetical protein